ncbi:hypothetical protein ACPPVO_29035 [Dactylosporangium sp. McL0621]
MRMHRLGWLAATAVLAAGCGSRTEDTGTTADRSSGDAGVAGGH